MESESGPEVCVTFAVFARRDIPLMDHCGSFVNNVWSMNLVIVNHHCIVFTSHVSVRKNDTRFRRFIGINPNARRANYQA